MSVGKINGKPSNYPRVVWMDHFGRSYGRLLTGGVADAGQAPLGGFLSRCRSSGDARHLDQGWWIATAEAFATVILASVEEACTVLQARGAGARTLDLVFGRVDGTAS